jgi:hypothetical protein
MKRNSTGLNEGIAGNCEAGNGHRLSIKIARRKVNAEWDRPEPAVSPAEVQERVRIANQQIADLTTTMEWFLFKSHVKIRKCLRDTFEDDWNYFCDLMRSMDSEADFIVVKSASPWVRQRHPAV